MAKQYTVQFHDDATFTSVPASIVVVPGTSFFLLATATQTTGDGIGPIDLTDCNLILSVINSVGMVRLYQTGTPSIVMRNVSRGRFSVNLPPTLTQVLKAGESHTLEIKSINTITNERRQICYASLSVAPSSLISE